MAEYYKVGIVTAEQIKNRQMGSSRLRAKNLVKYWDEAEIYQIGKQYDIIIFQKVWWTNFAKEFKGIKILDICDPDWFAGTEIRDMIINVHAITCSSQELANWIKKYTNKITKVIVDRDLPLQKGKIRILPNEMQKRAKMIGWFGYSQNQVLLDKFIPLIKELRLKLRIISDQNPPYIQANENIKFNEQNFEKFLQECDFLLLPKSDIGKFKYKSDNKKITAWRLGIPVAETAQEIKKFLKWENRRKEILKRIKEYPKKYDIRISVQEFKDLIVEIKSPMGNCMHRAQK